MQPKKGEEAVSVDPDYVWMEVIDIPIPPEIYIIAIPAEWVKLFLGQGGVAVVKKMQPLSAAFEAGMRHWFRFRLPFLVRGGVKLNSDGTRSLKFATVRLLDPAVYCAGYLVFQKTEQGDWRLVDAVPEAWVFHTAYSLNSRDARARYRVISTDALWYRTVRTSTAVVSCAGLAVLAKYPSFTIEYEKEQGDYRGPKLTVREHEKITLKEGGEVERVPLQDVDESELV